VTDQRHPARRPTGWIALQLEGAAAELGTKCEALEDAAHGLEELAEDCSRAE